MNIEHWLILYLFANGVLCYLGGSDEWDSIYRPSEWAKALIGAAFALPIALVAVTYEALCKLSKWLDGLIQFRTYWYYVFNRKRLMVEDKDILRIMHQLGKTTRSSNSIGDRLWRKAESLIHRVNRYTPPTNTTEG